MAIVFDKPQKSKIVFDEPGAKPRIVFDEPEESGTAGDYVAGAAASFADVGYATLEGVAALIGQATGDFEFAKTVSDFRNYSQDFYAGDVPEDVKDNFSYKATNAIAQMPAYAVSAMTGPLGLAALGANAFQQGRDDYLQTNGVTTDTATPEQLQSANKVGGITAIPLMLLERFGAGKVVSSIFSDAATVTAKDAAKRVLASTLSEGATEGMQTALQNTIASELMKYDPNRQITRDVVESMALGAIASGALTGPANVSEVAINRLNGHVQKGDVDPSDLQDKELGAKFAENMVKDGSVPQVGSSNPGKKYAGNAREFINDLIQPISAQLGQISPRAKAEIRRMESRIGTRSNQRSRVVSPFIQKLTNLRKKNSKDYNELAKQLYNGDSSDPDVLNSLLVKHEIKEEYESVRDVLDEVYQDAESVGMKGGQGKSLFIGYLDEYFPRSVRDVEGLMNSYADVIPRNEFERTLKKEEAELGRAMNANERAILLESFVKGNLRRNVAAGRPQNARERLIQTIEDKQLQFYERPEKSLASYIQNMTTGIETKRFLGVQEPNFEEGRDRIAGRLGQALEEEFQEGRLTNRDLDAVRIILQSRFSSKSPQNSFIKGAKNLGYIATMGNVGSAITQLGDFYFATYQNGILPTLTNLPKALVGKSDITMEDIGVDRNQVTIEAQEAGGILNDALNFVFKGTGLTKLDRVAKETNISAAYNNAKKVASNPKSNKYKLLRAKLISMQGTQQADQTLSDLRAGKKSDNVLELLFNQLSDVAPISMSEMPPMYAANPNGRMLYMLKSYTIKQFNFLREEAWNNMTDVKNPKTVAKGFKNLFKLATLAMIANGTADVLKDILFNREIDEEQIFWDNILRLFGLTRYTTRIGAEKGPGEALVKTILPPQVNIIDDIFKDVEGKVKGAYDLADMRSSKYIPFVGKLYYWQEGRGAEMEREYMFRD